MHFNFLSTGYNKTITSYILLTKTTNHIPHYKKINEKNSLDIIDLYNYLQTEYSSKDIEKIINNIAIFDEKLKINKKQSYEILYMSSQTIFYIDFENSNIIYLTSKENIEKLKTSSHFQHCKLSRRILFICLFGWNKIIKFFPEPEFVLLFKDNTDEIGFEVFNSEKNALQFIINHTKH